MSLGLQGNFNNSNKLIDKRPLRFNVTIEAFYKFTNNLTLIPIKPDNSHKNPLGGLLGVPLYPCLYESI